MTSADRALDESMSALCPQTTRLGGLPNISYILRKPEPLGTEMKSSVCPKLKIMTYLAIQRGKDGMATMSHNKEMGATAGCTMRMAEGMCQTHLDGKTECILGDSWFGSVRALCNLKKQHQKEGIFQVKTNSKGFPKKYINSVLCNAPGGTCIILKATDPDTRVNLVATRYKYNRRTILLFVSTEGAGSLTPRTPYDMRFPDRYGNVTIRKVPWPDLISRFFAMSNVVDIHNQLHQYSLRLEKKWITENPFFRLHTTLTGINVVDTFRLAQHHNILQKHGKNIKVQTFSDFGNDNLNQILIDEYSATSIKSFAGVLARQLLVYAQSHRRTVLVSINSKNDDDNASFSSDESVQDKEGPHDMTTSECYGTKMIEVLDVVFDVNGKKHYAVRNEFRAKFNGGGFTSSRVCQRSDCNNETRVKCLDCNQCFCYPIRDTSTVSKTNNCFVFHVHNVPKKYGPSKCGYIDLSGRKNP